MSQIIPFEKRPTYRARTLRDLKWWEWAITLVGWPIEVMGMLLIASGALAFGLNAIGWEFVKAFQIGLGGLTVGWVVMFLISRRDWTDGIISIVGWIHVGALMGSGIVPIGIVVSTGDGGSATKWMGTLTIIWIVSGTLALAPFIRNWWRDRFRFAVRV